MSKDARFFSAALVVASFLSMGASHRTQNFIVQADTSQLAVEIGEAAETFRRDLAIEWLGRELPPWSDICPITAQVSPQLGAGGATSFYFSQGRPHGWRMQLQGSRERVLDSVLPHEITHTIFATHFGQPLPRWADEGACTTVEHVSEKAKQQQMLITFLTTGRGIAFNHMFAMRDYPDDILPLYSQGYSLARYLIAAGGKQKFIRYVGDGLATNNWTAATQKHYGHRSLGELQQSWLSWVKRGSPLEPAPSLAGNEPVPSKTVSNSKDTPVQLATFQRDVADGRSNTWIARPEESWYARQKSLVMNGGGTGDDHRAVEPLTNSLSAQAVTPPDRPDTEAAEILPPNPTAVSRAQEIGRPTQMVLPPLAPVPPHAPGADVRTAGPAPIYLDTPTSRY